MTKQQHQGLGAAVTVARPWTLLLLQLPSAAAGVLVVWLLACALPGGWKTGTAAAGILIAACTLVAFSRRAERLLFAAIGARRVNPRREFGRELQFHLDRATGGMDRFDWYVDDRTEDANAGASGRFGVILSAGLLGMYQRGAARAEHVAALAAHEVGHIEGGFYRAGAALAAATQPWVRSRRLVAHAWASITDSQDPQVRLVAFLGPFILAGLVAMLAVSQPIILATAAAVAAALVLLAIFDRKALRAEEYRADVVAVRRGYGPPLLQFLSACPDPERFWFARVTATHPRPRDRVAAIQSQLQNSA